MKTMKKYLLILIFGLLPCSLVISGPSDPVIFNDLIFKAEVESQLSITDPNEAEMLGLTYFSATYKNLTDITGIGYATNLTYLELWNNQITSIPPEICNLTKLTGLFLHNNQLTSVPIGIQDLTDLSGLRLDNNPLNTDFYCNILPLLEVLQIRRLSYDSNINPISNDCTTDLFELEVFTSYWLATECNDLNSLCEGADLNRDGYVDLLDYQAFTSLWLLQ